MATKIIKAWINGAIQNIEVEEMTSPEQPLSVEERVDKLEDKHEVVISEGSMLVGDGTPELKEMTPDEVLEHINAMGFATTTTEEYDALYKDDYNTNVLYMFTDGDDRADWSQTDETAENYIKNKPDIDIIVDEINARIDEIDGSSGTGKVNVTDIVDNLTTQDSTKVLSANQGVVLQDQIKTSTTTGNAFTVQLGANGNVGGYKTGDVIEAGTSIQTILNRLLQKAVAATYTMPKISLASQNTSAGDYEYGTDITAQVEATFTKNDSGGLESISILKNGTTILSGDSSPLTSVAETIRLIDTVSYTASATYAAGVIKNNNLGEPSPSGKIEAGTITSSSVKFTPYRQGYFYGVLDTSSTNTPLTSDIIRSGSKKNAAYSAGNIPLISVSSVANRKRIFVACPATNTGITKVVMPSAQGADATKDFIKQPSTITVDGANGTTGIAYNVWVYEPALISDDQTFTVTLG